jgi:hypothetical protein
MIEEASKIEVPTLVINGEIASDLSPRAFLTEIRDVKWEKFGGSARASHLEERERFCRIVMGFLCDD